MNFKDDYSLQYSGKGIKVAVIDSGYTEHDKAVNIGDGINLASQKDLSTANNGPNKDFRDNIGHGNACIGIISKKVPNALIYPVKIFDKELVSNMNTLIEAIKWCIAKQVNIINLSLGIENVSDPTELEKVCIDAKNKGIIIVAANSNNGTLSIPASFKTCIGVDAGIIKGNYNYYFEKDATVQIIAKGDRQRVNWINGKKAFIGGTSFAAPHITCNLALILEKNPKINHETLLDILNTYSLKEKPEIFDPNIIKSVYGQNAQSGKKFSELVDENSACWIKQAVIFPFNKEMHSLIRFNELLPFTIQGVVDMVGKGSIGKDSGKFIGHKENGVIVQKNIEDCEGDYDTIILGYLDKISVIKKTDYMEKMLRLALDLNKNIYSLTPIDENKYPDIIKKFRAQNLKFASPVVNMDQYLSITNNFNKKAKIKTPVVGFFGTSSHQGKFTAQLAIRKELTNIGYKVGQIGTEHQSWLFDFEYCFPSGYDSETNIKVPMHLHIPLLQSTMVGLDNSENDIIIVGGQSGTIPYSYLEKTDLYTLPNIILLMATVPDAVVLTINSLDEIKYIRDTINVIEGLCKAKVILFTISSLKKEIISNYGRIKVVHQEHTEDEISAIKEKIRNEFSIPIVTVTKDEDRSMMAEVIINYFSKN